MIKPDPRKRDVVPLTGWEIVAWLGDCVKNDDFGARSRTRSEPGAGPGPSPEPDPARAGAGPGPSQSPSYYLS